MGAHASVVAVVVEDISLLVTMVVTTVPKVLMAAVDINVPQSLMKMM